ncbi:hypothetical protein GCK32_009707 [Trichostrongylus colubriformis]|uniref:Uncharacterized protein n=1 Tax=Trichostrongylus colubriformis TaxID=6319 RepID=A0AAN8F8U9_TRICO
MGEAGIAKVVSLSIPPILIMLCLHKFLCSYVYKNYACVRRRRGSTTLNENRLWGAPHSARISARILPELRSEFRVSVKPQTGENPKMACHSRMLAVDAVT